jgi:hypothetical protein
MRYILSRGILAGILGVLLVAERPGHAQGSLESKLLLPIRTPQGLQLSWADTDTGSHSNRAYTVQYQESLADGIWRVPDWLHPFPLFTNAWVDSELSKAARFYRVLRVPPAERGKVLAAELKAVVGLNEMRILFQLAGVSVTPRYSVRLYKLTRNHLAFGRTHDSFWSFVPA